MARYNANKIPYKLQDRLMDHFCETLARLKTKSDIRNFLKDLLNRQERIMLIRRLLIADMLISGKSHREIREKLKAGFPTISRVDRWLNFGRGGYETALKTIKK
ncbi:MAG: YerC/YecD family TrpR-related protein [Patescibacteria group bacterium]|nr:YerC/YecD family TrpR-related protein [Patescibacteria group bacterium]